MTVGMVFGQVIALMGKKINNESSVCYWAARHGIPIFCPALTDGSLGDMLYFHSYQSPGLVIDVVGDIRAINDEAIKASPRKTGVIVLGGGGWCAASSSVAAILMLSPQPACARADEHVEPGQGPLDVFMESLSLLWAPCQCLTEALRHLCQPAAHC